MDIVLKPFPKLDAAVVKEWNSVGNLEIGDSEGAANITSAMEKYHEGVAGYRLKFDELYDLLEPQTSLSSAQREGSRNSLRITEKSVFSLAARGEGVAQLQTEARTVEGDFAELNRVYSNGARLSPKLFSMSV